LEKDSALVADLKRGIRRWCELSFTDEGLQNIGLCSALRAFEQGVIFIMPHLL
jgi:hypothetical protein